MEYWKDMCCSDQVLFMFSPALCSSWHKPKRVYYTKSYWHGCGFYDVFNPRVLTLLHTKILPHFPTDIFYRTWPDLLLFIIQRKIPELLESAIGTQTDCYLKKTNPTLIYLIYCKINPTNPLGISQIRHML